MSKNKKQKQNKAKKKEERKNHEMRGGELKARTITNTLRKKEKKVKEYSTAKSPKVYARCPCQRAPLFPFVCLEKSLTRELA